MADTGISTGVSMGVTVDDAALRGLFWRLQDAGVRLGPAMAEIAGHLETETRHRFATGTGPDGVAWTPSRRAKRQGGQTLVDQGHLRDSVTSRSDDRSAEVGTDRAYAAIHQFGGTINRPARTVTVYRRLRGRMDRFADWRFVKRSKANYSETHQVPAYTIRMPARPFVGFGAGDMDAIRAILTDHLRAAGGGGTP
ncbi:phage virion morphogenesis protein [Azospirillum sp. RWY-5-1]|uniref:Phage virion morphogenesis protein n=1 Tax=Azospirillum oleiclasticum TaxID=2735135 RepID=A0ABX2T9U9_9PROT|nr:phage virion morphogenesis protein [Azospirillum oleiclasticum]NYZ12886.1 phage virion morphogenesis protein [Azospirillum oleiclasticum]NYZ20046.1 phage virion morphogenesis protein [Azospirillum oleiclasticum]